MRKIFLSILLAFILSGCAFNNFKPINDYAQRYHLIGLSVLPPGGGNWKVRYSENDPTRVEFGKFGPNEYETISARVNLTKVERNLSDEQLFKKIRDTYKQIDPVDKKKGYEKIDRTLEIINLDNTKCIQIYLWGKDQATVYINEGDDFAYIKVLAYVCRNPVNEMVVAVADYSQRYSPTVQPKEFDKYAKRFIESIKFISK